MQSCYTVGAHLMVYRTLFKHLIAYISRTAWVYIEYLSKYQPFLDFSTKFYQFTLMVLYVARIKICESREWELLKKPRVLNVAKGQIKKCPVY